MKKQLLFSRFCHVFCVFTGNLFKTGKNATMYKYIDSDGDENNSFSTELKCIWILVSIIKSLNFLMMLPWP
jgi:hypothetical protein